MGYELNVLERSASLSDMFLSLDIFRLPVENMFSVMWTISNNRRVSYLKETRWIVCKRIAVASILRLLLTLELPTLSK